MLELSDLCPLSKPKGCDAHQRSMISEDAVNVRILSSKKDRVPILKPVYWGVLDSHQTENTCRVVSYLTPPIHLAAFSWELRTQS